MSRRCESLRPPLILFTPSLNGKGNMIIWIKALFKTRNSTLIQMLRFESENLALLCELICFAELISTSEGTVSIPK